jgi:hypothetical protein
MTIGFVQVSEASTPNATAVSTSINVTAGNVLVVAAANGGTTQSPAPTISDTLGTNFNIIENLYNGGYPGDTGQYNSIYQLTFGVGLIQRSGFNILTARQQNPLSGQFISNTSMFILGAEYSGVFVTNGNVVTDQSDGREISGYGPFTETLPIQSSSWMVCAAIMLNSDFSGPGVGSLRINDVQAPVPFGSRFLFFDNTIGTVSANEGSNSLPWFIASFGLASVPPLPPPPELPATTWASPAVSSINRSQMDRIYPYRTLQVIPTQLAPLNFVCPHCRVGSQATIYRDIRDYSVSVGVPNLRQGGMAPGQSFDFVYCGACGYWYRKNDFKRVSAAAIVDVGISPKLNTVEDIGVGPPDEPEAWSIQANISNDDVRTNLQSMMYGFTDDGFERTGFIVQAIPTGSLEPS